MGVKLDKRENARWTIYVPRETDVALRRYLAQMGLRMSEFIADAVRWRLFDLNITAARKKNVDVPGVEIEDAMEQALAEARAERFKKPVWSG